MTTEQVVAFIGRKLWLTKRIATGEKVKTLVRVLAVTSSSNGMSRFRVLRDDGKCSNVNPFFLSLYSE